MRLAKWIGEVAEWLKAPDSKSQAKPTKAPQTQALPKASRPIVRVIVRQLTDCPPRLNHCRPMSVSALRDTLKRW
jgi:hypothetical protein